MRKWMPWPPVPTRKFQVKLVVQGLRGAKIGSLGQEGAAGGGKAAPLAVEVGWKGRPRTPLGPLWRSVRRNCTRGVEAAEGAQGVEWNEEFFCVCDLVGQKDGTFHPWEIALTVFYGFDYGTRNKISVVGTASLNFGEYVLATQDKEAEIHIPLHLMGAIHDQACSLNLFLSSVELKTSEESSELLPITITLVQLPPTSEDANTSDNGGLASMKSELRRVKTVKRISSQKSSKHVHDGVHSVRTDETEHEYPLDTDSIDGEIDDVEWEDEKEQNIQTCSYGTLATANYVGGSLYSEMSKNDTYDDLIYYSNRKSNADCSHTEGGSISATDLSSASHTLMKSILPWKRRRMSFKSTKCKGEPLLKSYGEVGGDDIDNDRRMLSSSDESLTYLGEEAALENSPVSKFGDDDFSVGRWERREIFSRDGTLKLCTQIFFASIDQRSERADGGSACTVLVAVIADWIQKNPGIMPTQSEFDSLIREGSSEWRNLCCDDTYREQFPDKHFDLETVLQAKVRPLSVVPDRSFVGFFHPEGIASDNPRFEFLHEALSFENIWNEINQVGSGCSDGPMTLYIVSWNDHFFIIKIEPEAYYIIDTLGERLFEGCKQAYVLKFDKDTEILKVPSDGNAAGEKETTSSHEASNGNQKEQQEEATQEPEAQSDGHGSVEVECLCRGKESCKEYIMTFWAAIRIRELLVDLKKGLMASTPLHQVLQVDFHYTKPSEQITVNDSQPETIELTMDLVSLVESPAA